MYLDSSGNLGIGTNSPAAKLDIVGNTNGTFFSARQTSANGSGVFIQPYNAANGGVVYSNWTTGDGSLGFAAGTGAAQMTLTNGGNLGIGTSSPAQKLDVVGNIRAAQTGATALVISNVNTPGTSYSSQFQLQIDGTYYGLVGAAGYAGLLTSGSAAGDMVLRTNTRKILFSTDDGATTALTLDSSGFLGVNDTPSLTQLQIKQSSTYGIGLNNSTANQNYTWRIDSGAGSPLVLGTRTTSTDLLSVSSTGSVGIGTNSPTTKLDVLGAGDAELRLRAGSDAALIFSETAANKNWKLKGTAGDFVWQYSATAYNSGYSALMSLTSSGNLGLGVTPSAWSSGKSFEIGNAGDGVSINYGYGLNLNRNAYYDSDFKYGSSDYASRYAQTSGQHQWYTAPSGTAGNAISFTQALTLTAAPNLKLGGTADRATTVGTNHFDIFDGTAPVGTLANGVSFYSASGEANVMDAAGNATLLSPHDAVTNEWIFRSKHTPTGKVLKIDVERLLKFVNDHFGLDAVHEFIEK